MAYIVMVPPRTARATARLLHCMRGLTAVAPGGLGTPMSPIHPSLHMFLAQCVMLIIVFARCMHACMHAGINARRHASQACVCTCVSTCVRAFVRACIFTLACSCVGVRARVQAGGRADRQSYKQACMWVPSVSTSGIDGCTATSYSA